MNFSFDAASRFLEENVAFLRAKGPEITAQLDTAYRLYQRALTVNDPALLQQAAAAIETQQRLRDNQADLTRRLDQFFPHTGLGLLPLVILAPVVAIPLAIYLYDHLQAVKNQAKALAMVEQGLLTAEEARGIAAPSPSIFGDVSGVMKAALPLALIGLFIWMGGPQLVRSWVK